MRASVFAAFLALGAAWLPAQTPDTATLAHTISDDLGFSYSLPADWMVVDTRPILPGVKQQQEAKATSEDEKKGVACMQAPFKATHSDPVSAIVIVTLPFDCYGQTFTDSDLAAFAGGVAGGLKQSWNVVDPVVGTYKLGGHLLWMQRASGSPIEHPEVKRSLEVVCTLLKKGAVCWMGVMANDADGQVFEHGAVTLEGDTAPALVPADIVLKAP